MDNDSACSLSQAQGIVVNQCNVTAEETVALGLGGSLLIPLYLIIFTVAITGNSLVIVTLIQNRRMRTVTNVFLLNLAVSDLLLGVFCMPFTLVGSLLREFIFGEFMCKAIPYCQAVSVSVSAWTLVSISVERYFAICQPLHSRRWQTLYHAYKIIAIVWLMSLIAMLPIAILSQLLSIRNSNKLKCREKWPSAESEEIFTIFLVIFLFCIPLVIMILTYTSAAFTLWKGIRIDLTTTQKAGACLNHLSQEGKLYLDYGQRGWRPTPKSSPNVPFFPVSNRCIPLSERDCRSTIRVNNIGQTLTAKKRIICMLFVMILEFFICWTPLYVVNTLSYFYPHAVYGSLGNVGVSLVQLLAYVSSCCNPITYCFMHRMFRDAFVAAFSCKRRSKWKYHRGREISELETSFYISPQSTVRRAS